MRAIAATAILALVTAALIGIVPADSAHAYGQATGRIGGTGSEISYPDGVTITASSTNGANGTVAMERPTDFGAASFGYTPGDYAPAPPAGTPAITSLVSQGAGCLAIDVSCADVGTLTYTFNRPLRNVRMHLDALGEAQGDYSYSSRLTVTTPGITPSIVSGRNLHVVDGGTIEAINKVLSSSCITPNSRPAGCGTVLFTGVTSSLTFSVSGYYARTDGTHPGGNGSGGAVDGFPTTFTFDEDFGDAPASYDQGNAASAAIGDMFLGATATADNPNAANSTTSPNASAAANADSDDALPNGIPSVVAVPGSTYGVTLPISSPTQSSTVCGWIDFNRNGRFDSPGERSCTGTLGPNTSSASLTWMIPAGTSPGASFARFRIGPDAEASTSSPVGASSQGEIEDYPVTLLAQSDFVCAADTVYSLEQGAPHTLARVTTSTGALMPVGQIDSASGDRLNGLALPFGGGRFAWAYDRDAQQVVKYDVRTGAVQTFAAPNALIDPVGGAIDPTTGLYYYASGGAEWTIGAFDTNTDTNIGTVATVSGPDLAGSGDIAFDSEGRLYIASTESTSDTLGTIVRVEGKLPTTAGAAALSGTLIASTSAPFIRFNSLAFDSAGDAVIAGPDIFRFNPANGALLSDKVPTAGIGIADFASCSVPNLIEGKVTLPAGRVAPTDQFMTMITGGGIGTVNTATTSGTASGLQAETAGPALGVDGVDYTVTQTGAGATDLSRYVTTWACVDVAHANAPVAAGTGSAAAFRMPSSDAALSVVCTFTNLPQATIRVQKALPSGRVIGGDQFTLTIGGPAVPPSATVTTTGTGTTAVGTAMFAAAIPGITYTINEAGADVGFYGTAWSCVDAGNGNTSITSGTGSTGSVTVPDPGGPNPADILCTFSNSALPASILLNKTAGPLRDLDGNGPNASDTIVYGFAVTNTGQLLLNPVTVTDPKVGAVTCPAGALAPGATVACTPVTYTLSQADVDSGAVNNTATATGVDPGGRPVTDRSSTSTPVVTVSAITLVKTAAPTTATTTGTDVTYTFSGTNTGLTTLSDVSVSDPLPGLSALSCTPAQPVATLAPGGTITCTATRALTQPDVDAGSVRNTATIVGTPPTGPRVSATAQATVAVPSSPAIELVKSAGPLVDANAESRNDSGDTITYSFTLTNSGNVTLIQATVTDPKVGQVTCPPDALAPAATVNCTAAAYALTQADIDAGSVDNTATAAARDPRGTPVESAPSSTSTPIAADFELALTMNARLGDDNGNGLADAGEHIVYTFVVTNTGTQTVESVAINDPKLAAAGLAITCPTGAVAPGASVTCTAQDWIVTAGEVAAGPIQNVATATARPLGQLTTLSTPPAEATVPVGLARTAIASVALAFTGANVLAPLSIMLVLFTIGLTLVVIQRRRRKS